MLIKERGIHVQADDYTQRQRQRQTERMDKDKDRYKERGRDSVLQQMRGGGLGSRPKKMYGERLGDGVEYHLMSPTPRR